MSNVGAWYMDVLPYLKRRLRTQVIRFLNDGLGFLRQTTALRPTRDDVDAPLGGSLSDHDRRAHDFSSSSDNSHGESLGAISQPRPPADTSGTIGLRKSDSCPVLPTSHSSH